MPFHVPAHKNAQHPPGQVVNPIPEEAAMYAERLLPNVDTLIRFEAGELDEDQAIAFIQDGIDKGWVWHLQGFYGRTAKMLMQQGLCRPAQTH